MKRTGIIFFLWMIVFLGSIFSAFASGPASVQKFINNNEWNFIENKGQLTDQKGNSLSDIMYYGHQGGANIYCKPGMISFVFTKNENGEKDSEITRTSATGSTMSPFGGGRGRISEREQKRNIAINHVDLILLHSNPDVQIVASEKQAYYENFYLNHTSDGAITNVQTYKTITYKSIYPEIDLIIHAQGGGFKYEFVVYPGGKVSDIKLQWNGLKSIKKLKDSNIEYSCSLGKMIENKPVSFQGDNVVKSNFSKSGNLIGFNIGRYNNTKTLIIDPFVTWDWGTYLGGKNMDAGNSVATDGFGNVYITGPAESQTGIATSGAYQSSFGGGSEDAFLAKFNRSGSLIWTTYYGGNGIDFGKGVATDGPGNIYITGYTGSASGIATTGSYKATLTGSDNAFLAKFNNNGILQWGTYFGGDNTESYSVATDYYGSLFIAGATQSAKGIATTGAFQNSKLGSNTNGFLAKFTTGGGIQWATYYGGSSGNACNGICTDGSGNVYITGQTGSADHIASSGALDTSYGGNDDAFLAKFDTDGKRIWATYYGGGGNDDGVGVAADRNGNIFLAGTTYSDSGIATNGAYQRSLSKPNYSDAFLAKFNSNGSIQWGTYYGGENNDLAGGLASDNFGNLYLMGSTESNTGIATTGAYQTSFGGVLDVFLAQFNNTGTLLWGTYYGGSDVDNGYSTAVDAAENVYITGYTRSNSRIATNGAHQTTLAGDQNAFLAQFNFKPSNNAGIISILNSKKTICAGKQTVNVQLRNFGNHDLNSVDISLAENGLFQSKYHWTGTLAPGGVDTIIIDSFLFKPYEIDTFKSWTSSPNGVYDSFPANDSSVIILSILPLPIAYTGPSATICEYDVKILGAQSGIGGNSYSWTSNPAGFTSTSFFVNVQPHITTTYYFTETNNATGCSKTDSVLITVYPAPPANTGPSKAICIGDSIKIGDSTSKGFTYSWVSTPKGFNSTVSNPIIKPSSTTSYTLTQKNTSTGCSNSNSVKITVNPLPVADVGQGTYAICNGTHIKIGANGLPDIIYSWSSNPAGFSSKLPNPVVSPGIYTQFFLTVTDSVTGCVNKNFSNVTVSILKAPVIDVGKNKAICIGESAQIGSTAISGDKYSWVSNPTGYTTTKANPVVDPLLTTSYSLTVTSAQGCTNFDSVTVTVNPRPHPVAGIPQNICSGTVIKLGEPDDSTHAYSWYSKPTGFKSVISDPVDSPGVSTEYYLKETVSATGCADSDSVRITVVPRPNASFDTKNINGFEYQFVVNKPNYPAWKYQWNFGDPGNLKSDTSFGYKVSHIYSLNGSYPVVLTVSLPGYCTVIDTGRIIIKESASFDIFPNPFVLQTDIKYVLLSPAHVKITMVDEIGRYIGTLVDKQLSPGEYNTIFDAGSWKTRPGMYFIVFQLDDAVTVEKILQIDSIYY